ALTSRQRGQVVRRLAAREHAGPDGKMVPVSRRTIDRWVVARREGGFDALVPSPRQCPPRAGTATEELAAGLKMENPARTGAQVIPRILYTDNGSCFADSSLARACAVLGITLTHSAPGRPMGRGKIERVFETIQQQFPAEVTGDEQHPARHPVKDLEELDGLLGAWLRGVYH